MREIEVKVIDGKTCVKAKDLTPNPTNESLKVSLKSGLVVEDIYFVDLSGKALKPKSVLTSNQGLEINVSNLKEGIYILEIASDKEVDKIKVVIER